MLRLCAVGCLAAAVVPLRAQSESSPVFFEMKACAGELRVFEDGTAITSNTDGTTTERRLTESRVLELRQIIARGPCQKEIRTSTATAKTSHCMGGWRSYNAPGEQEVVIRHYPDRESEVFPVYVPCDSKKGTNRSYNPIWQHFLSEVVGAIGGKNILEGCKCREELFRELVPPKVRQTRHLTTACTQSPIMLPLMYVGYRR
jgi:hypothetical protein